MEKITWRTQRKYFQEFNIIYSNSAIAFEMAWRRVSGSSSFFVGIGKRPKENVSHRFLIIKKAGKNFFVR
jgi:hypothetical protein